jgi:hypothetical protein
MGWVAFLASWRLDAGPGTGAEANEKEGVALVGLLSIPPATPSMSKYPVVVGVKPRLLLKTGGTAVVEEVEEDLEVGEMGEMGEIGETGTLLSVTPEG